MTARHWRAALVVLMVTGVLFAVRPLTSRLAPETLFLHSDKIAHVLYFALLWLLARRAGWRAAWPLAAGLIGYGVLIEVAQSVAPTNRSASLTDVVADAAGIGLSWVFEWRRGGRSAGQPEEDRG
jgi:VanZ family protein